MGIFYVFLNCTNGTKSRKVSYLFADNEVKKNKKVETPKICDFIFMWENSLLVQA